MLNTPSDTFFDNESRYVDRFGLLLIVTIAAVVVQSLVDIEGGEGNLSAAASYVIITSFVGAMLILAIRAAGARRKIRRVTEVVVALTLAAGVVMFAVDLVSDVDPAENAGATAPALAWMLMTALAPALVVFRLLHHRTVTRETLFGAIAAFLLIAVTFKYAFLAVNEYESTPFFGEAEPTTSYMYYSLVTVTTLGYGDLYATTDLGRLASVTEAVVGQVFLVTVVAMIVGLLVQKIPRRLAEAEEE